MIKYKLLLLALIVAILLNSCAIKADLDPLAVSTAEELASRFVAMLEAGDYAGAHSYLDRDMKSRLPEVKLKETWEILGQQAGPFIKEVGKQTDQIGQFTAVIITGRFTQAYIDIRITFGKQNRIAGLFFLPAENPGHAEYLPPEYEQPANFSEKEVTVGTGEWAVPGTLTLPHGSGPFPAAILVHGSGPSDRDLSIGPNKPFRDLAVGLASQGIAVLRYDKRTKVHGGKIAALQSLTVKEESLDDAHAAFAVLQTIPSVNPEKIFIIGHSLGGTLAPRIGVQNSKLAGLIILAGAARRLEDLVIEQSRYLAEDDGIITDQEKAQLELLEEHIQRIKDPHLSADTPSAQLLNAPASYWLDLRTYNAAQTASELAMPMLFLQGERDYQVTMEDFSLWQQALAGKYHATFKSYANLNHLFITGNKKSMPVEYDEPGHVEYIVIADLVTWIGQH